MTAVEAYEQKVLWALAIWREARGVPEAWLAVAWVMLNRLHDKRWPDTMVDVILQPKQFSAFNSGDANAVLLPNPARTADWVAFGKISQLIETPKIHVPDPTNGANHYHSFRDAKQFPKWADPSKVTIEIPPFIFYKL